MFILGKILQKNVFYDILEQRNAFQEHRNKKFKKSKNCDFFKGVSSWFWSKIGKFLHIFLKRKNRPNKCVYDILEGRNASLEYKNKKFRSQKIGIFPKGLVHGFGPKLVIFPDFYFRENRPGKKGFTIF